MLKSFDYYRMIDGTGVAYPTKSDYCKYYAYQKGKVVYEGKTKKDNGEGYVWEKVFDEDGYRNAVKVYRDERANRRIQFKRDLYDDWGVRDNPKAEIAYRIASEHKEDLEEIADMFGDLVALFKD